MYFAPLGSKLTANMWLTCDRFFSFVEVSNKILQNRNQF